MLVHGVKFIEGVEAIVVGGGEDRICHLNNLEFNRACSTRPIVPGTTRPWLSPFAGRAPSCGPPLHSSPLFDTPAQRTGTAVGRRSNLPCENAQRIRRRRPPPPSSSLAADKNAG